MLSAIEWEICETQAQLYEHTARDGLQMDRFSDSYLKSSFCKRAMDTIYSRFQIREPQELLDFLMPELGPMPKYDGDKCFDPDAAWWMGFTYRQLWYETGVPSSKLCDLVPFHRLLATYPGMHTIDEDMAAELLIQDFHLPQRAAENI